MILPYFFLFLALLIPDFAITMACLVMAQVFFLKGYLLCDASLKAIEEIEQRDNARELFERHIQGKFYSRLLDPFKWTYKQYFNRF